jgi:hypothetical protein
MDAIEVPVGGGRAAPPDPLRYLGAAAIVPNTCWTPYWTLGHINVAV